MMKTKTVLLTLGICASLLLAASGANADARKGGHYVGGVGPHHRGGHEVGGHTVHHPIRALLRRL